MCFQFGAIKTVRDSHALIDRRVHMCWIFASMQTVRVEGVCTCTFIGHFLLLYKEIAPARSYCRWEGCPCSIHCLPRILDVQTFHYCLFGFLTSELPVLSVYLLGNLFFVLNDTLSHKHLARSL